MGLWYSPFQLETAGVKEPPDAGSIPAPATRSKQKAPSGAFCICAVAGEARVEGDKRNRGPAPMKKFGIEPVHFNDLPKAIIGL